MPIKCYVWENKSEPPEPGAVWWGPLDPEYEPDARYLHIILPNGGHYTTLSNPRQCEVVGDLPNITIVKRDDDPMHECSISMWQNGRRFHGFLWHGELIDIDLAAKSKEEWDQISTEDQINMKAKTKQDYIRWPVRSSQ